MAATLDLSNVPGKRGGPYKAQAVHYPAPDKSHKVKLPSIPDLRFESAYLAAIQPFVQPLEEESRRGGKEKLTTPENVSNVTKTRFDYGVPIRINWPAILWVTLRDQVIIQFLTGGLYATWALFGTPFLQSIRVGITSLFKPPSRGTGAQPKVVRVSMHPRTTL